MKNYLGDNLNASSGSKAAMTARSLSFNSKFES